MEEGTAPVVRTWRRESLTNVRPGLARDSQWAPTAEFVFIEEKELQLAAFADALGYLSVKLVSRQVCEGATCVNVRTYTKYSPRVFVWTKFTNHLQLGEAADVRRKGACAGNDA